MTQPPGSHRPLHGLHLTANKVPHTRSCVGIGHSQRECSPLHHGEVPTHAGVEEETKLSKKSARSLFKTFCVQCQRKRKRVTTKGVVVKPIISKDYCSRAQVDFTDMQSMAKAQYKWIMNYQDHLTKLCVLRPLTSKRAFSCYTYTF